MSMTKDDLVMILKEARSLISDEIALTGKDLYPFWNSFKNGHQFQIGDRLQHILEGESESKLFKVIQAHAKQDNLSPSQATASLFQVIDVDHSGTIDDPIEYSVNMVVYKDKYYTYNGTIYLCTRDSGIALQYTPDQLIGHYFQLA